VVAREDGGKAFRVDYTPGQIGPEKGGVGWRFPIGKTAVAQLTYTVRFAADFDWVKGGKLPGLSGGPANVSGGRPADGTNGFSARLMWRKDGRGEAYVYHKNQKGGLWGQLCLSRRFPLSDRYADSRTDAGGDE
jgi:hypothetical protein